MLECSGTFWNNLEQLGDSGGSFNKHGGGFLNGRRLLKRHWLVSKGRRVVERTWVGFQTGTGGFQVVERAPAVF